MTCTPFKLGTAVGIICTGRARKPKGKAMGNFPETLDELQAAGYKFKGTGACRGCGVQMAWFETPAGKKMPFTRKGQDIPKRFESHHSVCPKRDEFKRTGR